MDNEDEGEDGGTKKKRGASSVVPTGKGTGRGRSAAKRPRKGNNKGGIGGSKVAEDDDADADYD